MVSLCQSAVRMRRSWSYSYIYIKLLLLVSYEAKIRAFVPNDRQQILSKNKFRRSWHSRSPPEVDVNKRIRLQSTDRNNIDLLPEINHRGIYQIESEEEYARFLRANPDKLVVVKFYASFCQACKVLGPKFIAVKEDQQLVGLPIVWAEFKSQRNNKELFQRLGVLTLPTVHFYDGDRGLVENFPCGPTRIPLLKKKLARFLNSRVDPNTLQLKQLETKDMQSTMEPPCKTRDFLDNEFITPRHIAYLRDELLFFQELTTYEFEALLQQGKLLTFLPGDTIIRQGMPGEMFFVIISGTAEMSVRSKFDDPISTPHYYLGAVVNVLKQYDYFGERALTTGEPYAASVRALSKIRCFAFHVEDIPESSILNRKREATRDMVEQLSQRYALPEGYTPLYPVTPRDGYVLDLLVRFKQIRQAAKCFQYALQLDPSWGNKGEIARRTMLVRKLSKAQQEEFQDVFDMIDVNKEGKITLVKMQKFMQSARENKSNDELKAIMQRVNPNHGLNADYGISRDEFLGVMAEAEFYNLITETFQELDKSKTGYVKAGDLDEILGGVRDLISNDQSRIIDIEDKEMHVDYEQFSRMLLGAAL